MKLTQSFKHKPNHKKLINLSSRSAGEFNRAADSLKLLRRNEHLYVHNGSGSLEPSCLLTTKELRIEPSPGFSRDVFWQPLKHETHHELFTESVSMIALSADDDKRIIQPDKIQTLAHGNFRTQGHRTG